MIEHSIIVCKCANVEHQLVFTHFPEDRDERQVYMSVHLIPESNIFRRIWSGIKYIFGHRSIYGHFDEFIFDQKDSYKLVEILKYLDPDVLDNKSLKSKNS